MSGQVLIVPDPSNWSSEDEAPPIIMDSSSERHWTPPVSPIIIDGHSPGVLDSSISEASWTPPTTPAKQSLRCSPEKQAVLANGRSNS